MKVALPVWENRISPVFDVARRLVVVVVDGETEIARERVSMQTEAVCPRAQRLVELGVGLLICGAISQALEELLGFHQIAVIPWVRGHVDEVMASYLAGAILQKRFPMPGCSGRHRTGRNRGGRAGLESGMRAVQ